MSVLALDNDLAYELIPTTDEQILQIDVELNDLFL